MKINFNNNTESFTAFTLAEVLITLGVIGVIAALTIPTLINKTNNKELANAFLKNYATIVEASKQIINDNSGDITNIFPTAQDLSDAFAQKLKVSKNCPNTQANGICWPNPVDAKNLAGNDFTGNYNDNAPTLNLNNGSSVRFYNNWYKPACNQWYITRGGKTEGVCAVLHIDVNGMKKPNQLGRDIFELALYPTLGIIGFGTQGDANDYSLGYCSTSYNGADSGCGCAAKVLLEGAINY